jgi:hypothetical protein
VLKAAQDQPSGVIRRSLCIVAGVIAGMIVQGAACPESSCWQPSRQVAVDSSIGAGHGGGSKGHDSNPLREFAEAESSCDETELRDLPSRSVPLGSKFRAANSRLRWPNRADLAGDQAVLVANAADLSRFCRLLL